MTGFPQTTIAFQQATGVPGELAYDGPHRSKPWQLISSPAANVIGATAYTAVSEGIAMAGGTGEFVGILINPKAYANFGGNQGGLAPTMTLPDDTIGELLTMGTPFVTLVAAANIGDKVFYNSTSGALTSEPRLTTFTGSIATTVLTVAGSVVGVLGVGSVISGAGVEPGTTIESLGTGTGGAGTYNINLSQTVASEAMSALPVAAAGLIQVPNAKVILRQTAAGGTAIIELTN